MPTVLERIADRLGVRLPWAVQIERQQKELTSLRTRVAQSDRIDTIQKLAGIPDVPRPALTDVEWEQRQGVREPPYNPRSLWAYYELDDTLQSVVQKIATEATRKGYELAPLFQAKCLQCGAEYSPSPEECSKCGNQAFREADPLGKAWQENFWKHLNPDVSTDAILEDTCVSSLILDNWFWWVRKEPFVLGGMVSYPVRVDVLDSRFIAAVTDQRGAFHSNEWFCSTCYWESKDSEAGIVVSEGAPNKTCPTCEEPYVMTAWIQRNRTGKTVGRWHKDEVIHGKRWGGSYRLYGMSKVVTLYLMIEALIYQSRYLISAYKDRRVFDGLLTLPLSPKEGKDMLADYKQRWTDKPEEQSIGILFSGGSQGQAMGEAKWLDMMGRLRDLAPLEFRTAYKKSIMAAYGVGEVLTGGQTAGQLGHPQDALDASYDTIEGQQTHQKDTVNRHLVSQFPPPAQEWVWQLVSPKQRDEKLDWEIRQIKLAVLSALKAAGKNADIDDEWEVEILPGQAVLPLDITSPPTPPALPPGGFSSLEKGAKTLTPRNIPSEDAIPKARTIENAYADRMARAHEKLSSGLIKSVDLGSGAEAARNEAYREFTEEAVKAARESASSAYLTALEDIGGNFNQQDMGAIEFLLTEYNGVIPALSSFTEENRKAFEKILRDGFMEGLDQRAMVKKMQALVPDERYKLDRIARTEITRVANTGRANGYKRAGVAEKREFHWITAYDDRVDELCLEKAKGGPYTLAEIEAFTQGTFLLHPGDRCVIARKPEGY
jgi:SPP1 gp7 family putative phage head morphogenesis protein